MVRNVTLFLAGVVSLALIVIEWPVVLPVLHVLVGH